MQEVQATRFPNYSNGTTVVYISPAGETLAYLDYLGDSGETASVTVFDPSSGSNDKGHIYRERPADKAKGILKRHMAKLGYSVTGEEGE